MAVSLGDDSSASNGPICPVCFRDYSDSEANLIPRILQCGHTYCTGEPVYILKLSSVTLYILFLALHVHVYIYRKCTVVDISLVASIIFLNQTTYKRSYSCALYSVP